MPKIVDDTPPGLRPYLALGLGLEVRSGSLQASGCDCPFCGRGDGKFSVSVASSQYDCKVCGTGGNALTFMRWLWDESVKRTRSTELAELAADRRLLHPETLAAWGAAQSVLTGRWLLPGRDPNGRLDQLYRYTKVKEGDRWLNKLLPTPGLWPDGQAHRLFMAGSTGLGRSDKPSSNGKPGAVRVLYICEGPWDGMALWEVLRYLKDKSVEVVAVPGCGIFKDSWAEAASSRFGEVAVLYDNDHPRRNGQRPGPEGAERTATLLLERGPADVKNLCWGEPDGYDRSLPDGYDVRDALASGVTLEARAGLWEKTVKPKLAPVGRDKRRAAATASAGISENCDSWRELTDCWRRALQWRRDLGDALATMLAVALSTRQDGDQLFLQVIGAAGSGKTRLCDALLRSERCFALEHLTGFHSGWKGDDGGDYSLIARVNNRTLITPEGDVLISNPKFGEIMSQQRRIFDGVSGATYKNRKEDMRYTNLRTPWIIAGTLALVNMDQSRLGDRFLRIFIDPPAAGEGDSILKRVGYAALAALKPTIHSAGTGVNGHAALSDLEVAYRKTGGYTTRVHDQAAELLAGVETEGREDALIEVCASIAKFTAMIRARPEPTRPHDHKEGQATAELPTRLTHQFMRLAVCLAAVTNRRTVDDPEVLRVVRKVARHTARGWTYDIATCLYDAGRVGLGARELALKTGHPPERDYALLSFLDKVGAVEHFTVGAGLLRTGRRWRLVPDFTALYDVAHAD